MTENQGIKTFSQPELPESSSKPKLILKFFFIIIFLVVITTAISLIFRSNTKNARTSSDANLILLPTPTMIPAPTPAFTSLTSIINRIAFIHDGNIWSIYPDGTDAKQHTQIDYKLKTTSYLKDYKDRFFDVLSISPDGSKVAVAGYSLSVRNALESGDPDQMNQFAGTESPFYPAHTDIYLIDLTNNTHEIISLENLGIKANGNYNLQRIEWLRNNQKLLLIASNSKSKILDLTTNQMSEVPVSSSIPGSISYLYKAYIPETTSLYFDAIFHVNSPDVVIASINLDPLNQSIYRELKLEGENQFSHTVPGINGLLFFATTINDLVRLYQYDLKTRLHDTLLELPDCSNSDKTILENCINIPGVTTRFSLYS